MPLIYLIRHGENNQVKQKRLAGRLPNVHLNDKGRQQAQSLAAILAEHTFQAVISSPLERTMETARPLATQLDVHVIPAEGLLEIDYGTWEGKTLKQLQRRKLWPLVQHHPARVRFPHGESFQEAQARAVAEVERLRSLYAARDARVACFSHSDIIKLILSYYIGLSLDHFQRLHVAPASISILALADDYVHLMTMNDQRANHPHPSL